MFSLFAFWSIGVNDEQQQKGPSRLWPLNGEQPLVCCQCSFISPTCSPFLLTLTPVLRSNSHLNCVTSQYDHHNILT